MDVLERVGARSSSTATPVSREPVSVIDAHVGMAHEPVADGRAAAVDDVDDAGGNARLVEQLDEALRRARACRSPA